LQFLPVEFFRRQTKAIQLGAYLSQAAYFLAAVTATVAAGGLA